MAKLERLTIENGKYKLEEKVIDVSPIKLTCINFDPLVLEQDINEDDGTADWQKDLKKIHAKKLRAFHKKAIGEANAYVLGEPEKGYSSGVGSFAGSETCTYPILYLKMKK